MLAHRADDQAVASGEIVSVSVSVYDHVHVHVHALGELPEESEELYALATVVNVACGGHAGSAESMKRAVTLAVRHGARIAAHPSNPDREQFGQALERLLETTGQVSPRSDRIGVRLEGTAMARRGHDRTPPAPMVRGAIQITTEGGPIVLGPDHPVTGGYPVIAVVGRASQSLLARLRPQRTLRFELDPRDRNIQ